MTSTVLESLKIIGPGGRRFLIFLLFNIIACQCLFGKFLILYSRALGVSSSGTGYLTSIIPFTMALSLFMKPISEKVGSKKLMFWGWLIRNILIIPILTVPWVYHHYGTQMAVVILFSTMLFFCLGRASSIVGWFPWIHELLDEGSQGRFMGLQVMAMRGVGVVSGIVAFIFFGDAQNTALWKFMVVNSFGVFFGFLSVWAITRIPKGLPNPIQNNSHIQDYFKVLRDKNFCKFLLWSTIGSAITVGHIMLVTLFMRDYLKLPDSLNLLATSAGGALTLLTVQHWGKAADKFGSPRITSITLGMAAITLTLIAFVQPSPYAKYLIIIFSAILTQSCAGFFVASRRGLLQQTKAALRNSYSAIWLTTTTLSTGILYLIIGRIICETKPLSYPICCLVLVVMLIASSIGSRFVKE